MSSTQVRDPEGRLGGAAWVAEVIRRAIEKKVSDVQFRFIGDIENARGLLIARASVNRRYQEWGRLEDARAAEALGYLKLSSELTTGPITRGYFGRWLFDGVEPAVDLRVTAASTLMGETFSVRHQTVQRVPLLSTIRFSEHNRALMMHAMKHPYGLFGVAGPGSSGKSYLTDSQLQFVASAEINAISVEHPAERRMPGVDQIEINDDTGNDYESVLGLLRRMHMQVLKLGELNFHEAAVAAVEIANAGTRVFTTLHANDAVDALTTVAELSGKPARLIANTTRMLISQRLLRAICPGCLKAGCERCEGSGVSGVVPVQQVLVMTEQLNEAFSRGAGRVELLAAARAGGMRTLWEDADELIAAGRTDEAEAEFEIGPRNA